MTTTVLAYIPSPPRGVWHLGIVPIRAYALLIIVGIVVALLIGDRRWRARGGEPGVIYDIMLWAVPFGLIGGRLYHVLTDWQTYFGDGGAGLVAALRIMDGGLGIWGAVALGGVGAWIGCRLRGIPLPAFGDAIAPGIVLAQAIGRIGNYFNQELYGRSTTLPWGLEIFERKNASGAVDSLNGVSTGQLIDVVHPTFLYELLWNVLVFVVLIVVDRKFKLGHGRLFALYVAGYCVGRFWIELMRSDVATTVEGIRINSFTSTFVFIGAVVYIMVAPKGREDPATLRGKNAAVEAERGEVDSNVKELAAVAATTGVVAAATVAGDAEDEDAAAVGDDPDDAAEALVDDVTDESPASEAESAEEAEAEVEAEADEQPVDAPSAEISESGHPAAAAPEAEDFVADIEEAESTAEVDRPAGESDEEISTAADEPVEQQDVDEAAEAEEAPEEAVAAEPESQPEPSSEAEPEAAVQAEADEQPDASGTEEAEDAETSVAGESVEVETEPSDESEAEAEPQEPQSEADVDEQPIATGSGQSAAPQAPSDVDESTDVEAQPVERTDSVAEPDGEQIGQVEAELSDGPEPDAVDEDAKGDESTLSEVTDDSQLPSQRPETQLVDNPASGRRRWWQRLRR